MIELTGNFWLEPADAYVITTNGSLKSNGSCVMGRGIAKQAKNRFPTLDRTLGLAIQNDGNVVNDLGKWVSAINRSYHIFSFPVKHQWYDKADIDLIEQSCMQLTTIIPVGYKKVLMVRPGCGNGRLDWAKEVRPVCKQHLNDRFAVIELEER